MNKEEELKLNQIFKKNLYEFSKVIFIKTNPDKRWKWHKTWGTIKKIKI